MKNTIVTMAVLGGLASTGYAELTWLEDFEAGKKAAAEQDKKMLVDFTGSDWCVWCIRLKDEVFDQPEFEKIAEDYVLVELDFPQDESLITPEQKAKNEQVAQEYGIQGFPTVILFDSEARPFAVTGYQEGGAEAYLSHIDNLDDPLEALNEAEGEERAEALASFLKSLEGIDITEHYSEELAELKKLDPEDKTGLQKELAYSAAVMEFETKIGEQLGSGEYDAAIETADSFLAEHNPEGENRQHVMMGRIMALVEKGEKEKSFTALDEMAAVKPDSELAQMVPMFKENITAALEEKAAAAGEEETE
ncbi:MAG: thioredoxin family protein [Verrucomicrobiota bacterium JB023]|nr:thioredoxin family protein [Verrucomicrobiota bacterium JB023]